MPLIIDKIERDPIKAIVAERTRQIEEREKLVLILPQIASEVTFAIRAADLAIPIFFMVPTTGDTLLMFATPIDPTDADWDRATEIIRKVLGAKIGVENLVARPVHCVSAGMPFRAFGASTTGVCDAGGIDVPMSEARTDVGISHDVIPSMLSGVCLAQ